MNGENLDDRDFGTGSKGSVRVHLVFTMRPLVPRMKDGGTKKRGIFLHLKTVETFASTPIAAIILAMFLFPIQSTM